jgi:hypothetical protein
MPTLQTTVPVSAGPIVDTYHPYDYPYLDALVAVRQASTIATRAAHRIARIYDDHAWAEIDAACDRIIARCEVLNTINELKGV